MGQFLNDDTAQVKHLLLRASFGLSPKELDFIQGKKAADILPKLMSQKYSVIDSMSAENERLFQRNKKTVTMTKEDKKERGQLRFDLQEKWVDAMSEDIMTGNPFLERISLFWHGHFACMSRDYEYILQYLEAIRKNALGNVRDLLMAVSKTGAMLRYLDNQQNTKKSPNENFARELLELFTLGEGNYTEKDIQEAARALTGWMSDKHGNFQFEPRRHDDGQKTFMGKSGNFKGEDIIDIILENKQTAKYIAKKVYLYFVNEEPVQRDIDELADVFFKSKYDIKAMFQHLFSAKWFYEERNVGTKIKSPIDLLVGIGKVIHTDYGPNNNLLYFQRVLGQELFSPPNVAGWPMGLKWINNTTLLYRLKMTSILMQRADYELNLDEVAEDFNFNPNSRNRFKTIATDFSELESSLNRVGPNQIMDYLKSLLLALPNSFQGRQKSDGRARFNLTDGFLEITSLPEYQVC